MSFKILVIFLFHTQRLIFPPLPSITVTLIPPFQDFSKGFDQCNDQSLSSFLVNDRTSSLLHIYEHISNKKLKD